MTITRFSTGYKGENALATNISFATSDFEWISTIRVGSTNTASLTFSNIPQEYKHLQLRFIVKDTTTSVGTSIAARYNSDGGTNYSWHGLNGSGSAVTSSGSASNAYAYIGLGSGSTYTNMFGANIVDIFDYSLTNKYKTSRSLQGSDTNSTTGYICLQSCSWLNTAAITTIDLYIPGYSFTQYTKFSLYGIRG